MIPQDRKKHLNEILDRNKAEITARQKKYEELNESPLILLYSVLLTVGLIGMYLLIYWLTNY